MKTTKHLINWMEKMVDKYPFVYFKYEYLTERDKHIICVYPRKKIEKCEAYCKDEIDFYDEIDQLFPNESILFGDEDEFFTCSANALVIRKTSMIHA